VTPEETMHLDAVDEKARLTFRRLLLSKQLYLHGLDHSHRAGALNKMIAVHNFHNAIEIVLRAVFLHYDIRPDKELNIAFGAMLSEIANHQDFRSKGIKLPYHRELLNLNQLRNIVQHHAVEPPSATMDEWRVFTKRFLERACQIYFGIEFDGISLLETIEDTILKRLLGLSLLNISGNDLKRSLTLAKVAFECAAESIWSFLPEEGPSSKYSITRPIQMYDFQLRALRRPSIPHELRTTLEETFEILAEKARKAECYAALLSSGVSLVDYKRFESSTPQVSFSLDHSVHAHWGKAEPDEETTRWVHDFVVNAIAQWQFLGLAPTVSDWHKETAQKLFENDSRVVV
jgi:hypothetical protein